MPASSSPSWRRWGWCCTPGCYQWFEGLAGRRLPPESVQKLARPVSEYVLFTLAASMTTLPVILYHFGRLSLVSLVANPAILPAQPPLMVLEGASLLLGSAVRAARTDSCRPDPAVRRLHRAGGGAVCLHPGQHACRWVRFPWAGCCCFTACCLG